MMKKIIFTLCWLCSLVVNAQNILTGTVVNTKGVRVPFASISVNNSIEGTLADDNGVFMLETSLLITSLEVIAEGYQKQICTITSLNPMIVVMKPMEVFSKETSSTLKEVVIKTNKRIKNKNNPGYELLKKLLDQEYQNSSQKLGYYQLEKYEKIEFDINNIDSLLIKQKLFKDMQFVFKKMDTLEKSGRKYLPVYLNEGVYNVYGNQKHTKEDLIGNKSSSLGTGQGMTNYIKDLFVNYNIYEDYIRLFGKSFVSPLSKIGVASYNYKLSDSAVIEGRKCYKLIFYPIRSNELTFRGSVWIADEIYAAKKIDFKVSKSANLNWIKEVHLSQTFDFVKDNIPVLKKDYILTDFSIQKHSSAIGMFGKRTTFYTQHLFDEKKEEAFYKQTYDIYQDSIYHQPDVFWNQHRIEPLSKQEMGVYEMIEQLKNVPTFKNIYHLGITLASGYVEYPNFDFGPIFSTFGYNDVEKLRIRLGGRTYFGLNDRWRIQGYGAYGFGDGKFKYGIAYKQMFNEKNRWIVGIGRRDDVEQLGGALATTMDVLNKDLGTSSLLMTGNTFRMAKVISNNILVSVAPYKNSVFSVGINYKQMESASKLFTMAYLNRFGQVQEHTQQLEIGATINITPKRKTFGKGVELRDVNDNYATYYLSYCKGIPSGNMSDFSYDRFQVYVKRPFYLGVLGKSTVNLEAGKILGTVSLGLLSAIPANQSIINRPNTFEMLNFYEFVTDTYVTMHFEHNFNGLILGKIPLLKKMKWREVVGIKAAYGTISTENIQSNLYSLQSLPFKAMNKEAIAPTKTYLEYNFALANILKMFRVDLLWRGNYNQEPAINKIGLKGSFGFVF